jgi:hypothetical protein
LINDKLAYKIYKTSIEDVNQGDGIDLRGDRLNRGNSPILGISALNIKAGQNIWVYLPGTVSEIVINEIVDLTSNAELYYDADFGGWVNSASTEYTNFIITNPSNKTLTSTLPIGTKVEGIIIYSKDINSSPSTIFNKIQFDTTYTPGTEPEGLVWWNSDDYTLNISTGIGPVLQVGQEDYIVVYNANAYQIDNGKVVQPSGGLTGNIINIDKAIANTHEGFERAIWVTTMDIPASSIGLAVKFGKVRNLDTSTFNLGDTVYLSDTTAGELTSTPPSFPSYRVQIGGIAVKDSTNGELFVSPRGEESQDTAINFWNGAFRESFDFRIESNGSVITGYLNPSNGHDDMTMIFSDGFSMLTTMPPVEIVLTAGTDTNPQVNYVYVPKSTKTLTVSTSSFPYDSEHIKVAQVLLQSVVSVQHNGALRNQNWNDHIEDTKTFQGHLLHIGEKLRQFEAQWFSGTSGSVTINSTPTPDNVFIKVTSGIVYQLHRQNFPILDMNPHTIDAVDIVLKTFTISGDGDLSSIFPDGRLINVNGSTGNNGLYTIDSTTYSAPDFIITVEEPIPDTTADGYIADDIHVVNNFTTSYKKILNLNSETTDALGNTLANKSFSFVLWGVANKSGEPSHIMLNLPTGSYARLSPDLAVNDANNYSVYSIPDEFKGVGFLIARFTFQLGPVGQSWTLYNTEDLRGKIPNSTAGGGAGGGGVTEFTGLNDTPSTYISEAGNFTKVNDSENAIEFSSLNEDSSGNISISGVLKIGQFNATEASGLTPANGDFIYVTSTNGTFTSIGFWGYESGSWVKL